MGGRRTWSDEHSLGPGGAIMFVSVVCCTRNRAPQLERLLRTFVAMEIPADLEWEVLIIDNGSTDATQPTVQSFVDALPIRYEFETIIGITPARNRALAVAKGDYIAWTDDDCEVAPGWIAAYSTAFRKFPDAVIFGGTIVPQLESPVTPWFEENLNRLQWVVAARAFGSEYRPLSVTTDCLPFGANAAVRMAEQRQHPYQSNLGEAFEGRAVGEEIIVYRNILNAGHSGIWVPNAAITHNITSSRQTVSYVRDYYFGHGVFGARSELANGVRSPIWLLAHYIPRLIANYLLFRLLQPFCPARFWLKYLMNVGSHFGTISYTFRTSRLFQRLASP